LSMRHILENTSWILRFVEWHIRERTGGNERTGHQSILGQISSLLQGLYGSSDAANECRLAKSSLDVVPAKDVFADLVFDYDRLILAAKNALEEARVNWEAVSKQKTRHGEPVDMTYAAIQVRDSLILAFLIWRPMRAENVAAMELDINLAKTTNSEWRLMFDARLMKGRRPWAAMFPKGSWSTWSFTLPRSDRSFLEMAKPAIRGLARYS